MKRFWRWLWHTEEIRPSVWPSDLGEANGNGAHIIYLPRPNEPYDWDRDVV